MSGWGRVVSQVRLDGSQELQLVRAATAHEGRKRLRHAELKALDTQRGTKKHHRATASGTQTECNEPASASSAKRSNCFVLRCDGRHVFRPAGVWQVEKALDVIPWI